MYKYNFYQIFSLETNIPYFEGMFHAFRSSSNEGFELQFLLDEELTLSTDEKERINLMLYHKSDDGYIEFNYPWFRPIYAKLTFQDKVWSFRFNKNYLRFSNIVAEGWELIDVFRSLLLTNLINAGMYMVHAAAVKLGEEGILMPAFGNTGKTSTSWMLAKRGAQFLTDEFAVLNSAGNCFGIPCSSLLSPNTIKKLNINLTLKEQLSLFFGELKSKVVSTRFAPGGLKVYPDGIFQICDNAKITEIVIIQNGIDSVRKISQEEAFRKIKSIQTYEFNWKTNPYVLALSYFDSFDVGLLSSVEDQFLRAFLCKIENLYVVSSSTAEHYKLIERLSVSGKH